MGHSLGALAMLMPLTKELEGPVYSTGMEPPLQPPKGWHRDLSDHHLTVSPVSAPLPSVFHHLVVLSESLHHGTQSSFLPPLTKLYPVTVHNTWSFCIAPQ